jgi:DNA-binding SARP family transcriptional activator
LSKECSIWLDSAVLKKTVREYRVKSTNISELEIDQLEVAVGLYRGDFLQGFSLSNCERYQDWVFGERQYLFELMLEGLEKIILHQFREGRFFAGVTKARRYLSFDPTNESVLRMLMVMCCQLGRRRDAILKCEEIESTLEAENEISLDQMTVKLCNDIRQGKDVSIDDINRISH